MKMERWEKVSGEEMEDGEDERWMRGGLVC